MNEYKVVYTYTDYDEAPEGKRTRGCDIYEANDAQDAVNQCREESFRCEEIEIEEVREWLIMGWSLPKSNWF